MKDLFWNLQSEELLFSCKVFTKFKACITERKGKNFNIYRKLGNFSMKTFAEDDH